MDEHGVHIRTTGSFTPSDRLRAALDRLVDEHGARISVDDGDEDVTGFSADRLKVGSLDGGLGSRPSTSWNDGCWFYNDTRGTCGWYQGGDGSCIGYLFKVS